MYISVIKMAHKQIKKKHDNADLIMKGVIVGVAIFLLANQQAYAADISTGMSKLDAGAWKIVKVFQSAIFWGSMIYSFRALGELVFNGNGNWKKVGTGFMLCAGDYLIPWLFTIIRDSFA